MMNISLAIFNLLPFPPFDGSKVLATRSARQCAAALEMLEQYGFLILIVVMYMGLFSMIIGPVSAS